MGRVSRLMERRTLRRAADQALLTALTQRPDGSAPGQPGGAPDQDFQYTRSDPSYTGETYDHEPVTAPTPVATVREVAPDQPDDLPHDDYGWVDDQDPHVAADVYDLVPGEPDGPEFDDTRAVPATESVMAAPVDDYGWDEDESDEVPPPVAAPVRPLRARPLAESDLARPALDFAMPESRPWYRAPLASVVLVAAVIAAVVCGGWLVFRSPSTTAEQSNVDAPASAPPAPTKQQPTAMSAPQRPPPPPPPPPPEEPAYTAPQRQYSEPRYSAPEPAEKPRVDVTRAPMSVAPSPRQVEGSDSSTPGDKPRRRGCFGFC